MVGTLNVSLSFVQMIPDGVDLFPYVMLRDPRDIPGSRDRKLRAGHVIVNNDLGTNDKQSNKQMKSRVSLHLDSKNG